MNDTKKPNQHVMAFITFVTLVPLVYFIPDLIAHLLPGSKLLNVTIAVGIIVPIISYVVMPISIKVIARFKR